MKFLENICYAERENERLLLDIYLPEASEFSLFVFFHGGCLEKGSKAETKRFAK